jgi:type IV secretory pathway VirB9-like protein
VDRSKRSYALPREVNQAWLWKTIFGDAEWVDGVVQRDGKRTATKGRIQTMEI